METVNYLAIGLAVVGVALTVLFSIRQRSGATYLGPADEQGNSGKKILYAFAAIVAIFGAFAIYTYRALLFKSIDDVFYLCGVVLTMIFGMFVQVLYSAYRENRNFKVTATQLVLPLLFSIVVFYPTWTTAAGSVRGLYAFYVAFLNGFFWESLVTAAKPPQPPQG